MTWITSMMGWSGVGGRVETLFYFCLMFLRFSVNLFDFQWNSPSLPCSSSSLFFSLTYFLSSLFQTLSNKSIFQNLLKEVYIFFIPFSTSSLCLALRVLYCLVCLFPCFVSLCLTCVCVKETYTQAHIHYSSLSRIYLMATVIHQ